MKNRAEFDHEIEQENRAIMHIERGIYQWSDARKRAERDGHIMELWEMGYSREDIAEKVDLTVQRVSQIVNSFGAGWR